MTKHYRSIESAVIHGGISEDAATGAVNIPIYQTSTFRQKALGANPKWEYGRSGNPSRSAVEALIAELEGGVQGFAFASGLAAISAVLSLLSAGDRVLMSENVYGGTYRLLDRVFKNFNIAYELTDTGDTEKVRYALESGRFQMLMIETPTNPLLRVSDIAALSAAAHEFGAKAVVDNTFMTPYLQRPLALGADLVVHSGTKYLGGHSDVISGLVVAKSAEDAERLAFLQNATGGVLSPFDSFLLQRGIKTLSVRMDRHVENARKLLKFLSLHPAVESVFYPGLNSREEASVQARQAKNGGAMLSFKLRPGYSTAAFFAGLRLIALAESLGGVESLACHPATMTHAALSPELRASLGITDNLVRLSVGIEKAEDLIADLEAAFVAAKTANI
jgi:cystathionine beta-lyase